MLLICLDHVMSCTVRGYRRISTGKRENLRSLPAFCIPAASDGFITERDISSERFPERDARLLTILSLVFLSRLG